MISREQEEQIAGRHARRTGLGTCIREVERLAEIISSPPGILIRSALVLAECWIAYVTTEKEFLRLESSTIVVIHATSGKIEYSKSAGDEC
jgi:hypothetical protein